MQTLPLLAVIQGKDLVSSVVWVIVAGIIFGLLWWLIAYCSIPEPFAKIARVLLAICTVLFLINVLLTIVGHPIIAGW